MTIWGRKQLAEIILALEAASAREGEALASVRAKVEKMEPDPWYKLSATIAHNKLKRYVLAEIDAESKAKEGQKE